MKRFIAIGLSLVLVACLAVTLSSCKSKDNGDTTDTTSTTEAAAAESKHTADVGEKSLIVYKNGEQFQELSYVEGDDSFDLEYAKQHIEFVDMNFDGELDICLATHTTAYAVCYYCWLYDAATGKFVYSEDLSALTTISVDNEDKQIISLVHESAAKSYYVCYEWKDGKLTEVKKMDVDDKDIPQSVSNAVTDNTLGTKVNASTTSRNDSNTSSKTTTKKAGGNTTTTKKSGGVQIVTGGMDDGWF